LDAAWQQKLAALRAHVAAHGRLPPQHGASGLGDWVSHQRQARKAMEAGRKCRQGMMTPARVAALEAVPGWAWEVDAEAAWQERPDALRAYVGAHGRLPQRRDASSLGDWVVNQRQAKKAIDMGRKSDTKMTSQRVAALEAVPGWDWGVGHAVPWEERLAALRAYVGAHGRLPPTRDASGMGSWISDQRRAKSAMDAGSESNKMTPARAAALDGVPGWAWEVNFEALWQEKLAALRAYVAAHGRLPLQSDASGLGVWVNSQRQAKKAAEAGRPLGQRMTLQRVAALEAVPGWTWGTRRRAAAPDALPAKRVKKAGQQCVRDER
jgi:ribosomal protein S18